MKGVPVPDEPYIRMVFPLDERLFWETPALAQLYIYMLCSAFNKETYTIGTGGEALLLGVGDYILSYSEIRQTLHCSEWVLKKRLQLLETCGAIARHGRVGNQGILVHLNYYPAQVKKHATKAPKKASAGVPERNNNVKAKATVANNKDSKKTTEEIRNTPVTEAIKYLFIDLKRNKDISRLNRIIDYVNVNLPKNFPMDKLKEAVNGYYEQHRSEYIDEVKLVGYLTAYNNRCMLHQQSQKDNSYQERQIEERLAKERGRGARFNNDWKVVGDAYKEYQKTGSVSTCPEDEVSSVFYTLWYSNNKGNYVNELATSTGIPADKKRYVERFFFHIGSLDQLRSIWQTEYQRLQGECRKNIAAIRAEYKEQTA